MKIEKKHIIIALVAVFALWFLWKKGLFNKLKASASGTADTAASDASSIDLDYILSRVSYNSTERAAIRKLAEQAETNTDKRQSLQAKAYKNGLSLDQQIACDAIWMLYHTKTNGVWSDSWNNSRGKELNNEVVNL